MGTLSPIFPQRISSTCSSVEATRRVGVSVFCFVTANTSMTCPDNACHLDAGTANAYNEGRMRYQRRERRERPRDVSRLLTSWRTAEGDIESLFVFLRFFESLNFLVCLFVCFAGGAGSLCAGHANTHPGHCVGAQSDHGQQPPLQSQLQAVSLASQF